MCSPCAKVPWHHRPIKEWLAQIEESVIEPFLEKYFYGDQSFDLNRSPDVSRNINDFEEQVRTRSMLWHWDGKHNEDAMVKILLYLSDVSNRHGCMVALRHNKTGETFKVDGDKGSEARFRPWGDAFTVLPRIWLAELMQQGYQPSCLEGPAGTMIFFDVNIFCAQREQARSRASP